MVEDRPGGHLHAPLLEREAELSALTQRIDAARGGTGSLVVVEGPPGIGKSRLLEAGREAADGFRVLRARGGELERDFPWGVARQLFEAQVLLAPEDERAALLAGAAAHAAEPLGLAAAPAGPDAGFAALHGLHWLTVNLAARGPLVLCVDDAHWADGPSLRFLSYLGRRVEELPVLVLVAQRPIEPGSGPDLAADGRLVAPASLSVAAVAELVRHAWPDAAPAPAFSAACHRASGGNPFLLAELLGHLRAAGVPPDDAQAARVEDVGPRAVARSVRRRLADLPAGCVELAQAVAVLGTDAEPRHAGALAGLDDASAARAADALAIAETLRPGRPLEFVHPVVRAAVREDIPGGERMELHRRAARLLADDGAGPGRVGVHLLATDPRGDAWAAGVLLSAAERAFDRGAPDAAARFLRRALAEPPSPAERVTVLRDLGRVGLFAGDPSGPEHYAAAIEACDDPALRAAIGREAGVASVPNGAYEEAVRTLEVAAQDARRAGDPELELLVQADLGTAGRMSPRTVAGARERAERLLERDDLDATPAGRSVLCGLALHACCSGRSASEAAALARRGLAQGLPIHPSRSNTQWDAGFALAVAEALDEAAAVLETTRREARRGGSVLTVARASSFLSFVELRRGNVLAAADEATESLEAAEGRAWFLRRMTTGFLVDALRERGDFAAVDAALEAVDAHGEIDNVFMWNLLLFSRGRARVARGQLEPGLADLELVGAREGLWFGDNPAAMPWRSWAARALVGLGRETEAARLAAEELELAHAWGTARAIGVARHAGALAESGRRAVAGLEGAVGVLEASPAPLELAHALVDLGAAVRRSGAHVSAREWLGRGMDLAQRCGALALAERAATELRISGARPRRLALSGVESLTASERRVAHLAAEGMTNREIAQTLFVTMRTVEVHLTHAYGKLGITSRSELPGALTRAAHTTVFTGD